MQKNHQFDVSIIIINYNSENMLLNCIESIKKHTSEVKYEIIIVDNNSKDDSLKKVLEKNYENLSIIKNKENRGFGSANNQGIKIATGEFILFLNNDIIFIENSILYLIEYLRNKKRKILIAPRLLNQDGTIQHSVYSFLTLWLAFTTFFFLYKIFPRSKYFNRYYLMNSGISTITEVETITGAFMLFKKKDILELNGFDIDFFFYGEDNDLCKRFRDKGGKIIYYPFTQVIHLKGSSPKTNWFHEKNRMVSLIYLFNKHYTKSKKITAYFFLIIGVILRIIFLNAKFLFTFDKNFLYIAKLKFKALLFSFYIIK